MKRLLMLAAVLEAATGLALFVAPTLVARLLLGANLSAAGVAVGRVAGCALVALAIACWPSREPSRLLIPAARAMLTYNALVACYLTYLGIRGQFSGVLLWPVAVIHGLISLLLLREWMTAPLSPDTKG
jgi:hypothetical protein